MGRKSILEPYVLYSDAALTGSTGYLLVNVKNLDFLNIDIYAGTASADTIDFLFGSVSFFKDGTYTTPKLLDIGAPLYFDISDADGAVLMDVRTVNTVIIIGQVRSAGPFDVRIVVSGKVGGA